MISTLQIIVIAFAYLCLLFLIAYISDKNKPHVISARRKALVYSFSLAIYCTSWTFYGAVGSAAKTGWGYLPIYLGPILIYTLGWPLLKRFILLGHEQNTTSISDFIASRYGKSQAIAAIVTIIAVVAIIPYIALQLKAITASIQVFDAQQHLFSDYHFNSFFITLLLIVFSILFGTRHLDVTEHQYGMMNAIAFESIVKLIAFCAVGFFALYSIFDGTENLLQVMRTDEKLNQLWFKNIDIENFITQTILGATAILCLPRQFHVTVVEYHQPKDILYARWIFPGYLILISLFVIPIVVAGSQYFANQPINADTYILALPLAEKHGLLSALVFIGGLSAASGMVIVATVAISTMISNDLVLPIILQKEGSQYFKDKYFNSKILLTRRIAISAFLLLSYGFYRLFDKSQSLASIGFLSFTAVLQFMPALIIGMFWRRATKIGAITGLISGIVCWIILTWIPSINGFDLLTPSNRLTSFSYLTESLLVSLLVNISAIFIFSKISQQTLTEKIQAYYYTKATTKDLDSIKNKTKKAQILVKDLKSLTATIVGTERMVASYESFPHVLNDNDFADEELILYTEKILSASIGASSARVVILSAFKDKGINVDDVINLLSSTSQALKFNRRMLEVTMDNITQGISVSDAEKNLVGWNHSYENLMNYPKNFLHTGISVADLISFNANRGYCGPGDVNEHIAKRLGHLESGLSYRSEHIREDGMVIEIVGNALPQGGYVTTYTNVTEYKKIEAALKENERQTALYTDNSPILLAYLDKDLIFRFVNKAMANAHGLKKDQMVGQKITDLLTAKEIEFKHQYLQLALQNNKQQFEFASLGINSKYYLITYIPNLDKMNNVIGIYTIDQDISNRRKAELALKEINITLEQRVAMRTDELHNIVTELESAKAEAEKANSSKSKFLAAASHDLLQPFNAARLFNEILISEPGTMTPEQVSLVEKTDQSLGMAENIIRSLVDISKLDSGTIHPTIRPCNIYDTLDSLDKQFSGFAEKKKLRFKILKKNIFVKSDPELLYRILQNFVSNAIRYTHRGGILVTSQKQKNYVRVSVWDTGIGIQEEHKNDIFNEFKQLSDPENQSTESGIGLGLSISERIAAILGHPIYFNSEHGKGTAFHILIKCAETQQSEGPFNVHQDPIIQAPLTGLKVLCVDNEIQITDAMSLLIKRWGCEVQTARSQNQIESIINSAFIPDLLIVDYQLDQGKTGLGFIKQFREQIKINIPAFIVTADHTKKVNDKIINQGFTLLHKPIKPAMLRATINNELRNKK